MLTSVIDHGTGARAKALGRPLAGKTGTSNGPKDTWFAGYSTDIAASSWVGYDDGRPLGGAEQGAVTALPAWMDVHEGGPREREQAARRLPATAGRGHGRDRRAHGRSSPTPTTPTCMDEVFLAGHGADGDRRAAPDAGPSAQGGQTAQQQTAGKSHPTCESMRAEWGRVWHRSPQRLPRPSSRTELVRRAALRR